MEKDNNKKQYFLATTALEEFWDTSKPVVFLGEWCKRYSRRETWGALDHEMAPVAFKNTEELQDAYNYLNGIYEELLNEMTLILNSIHGRDSSPRYWRIVLGNWLFDYISAVYDRYLSLSVAVENHPSLVTIKMSKESFVTPRDTLDFLQLVCDDPYNLQLYSRILDLLLPNNKFPAKEFKIESKNFANGMVDPGFITEIKRVARNIINRGFLRIGKKPVVLLKQVYFPPDTQKEVLRSGRGKIGILKDLPAVLCRSQNNEALRSKFREIKISADGFTSVLLALLPLDIPQCFIENYRGLQKKIASLPRAEMIISAVGWYADEPFKQWAAAEMEKGAILAGAQHGGNYGSDLFIFAEDHELKITDYYFSWGWERNNVSSKVVPFNATKLAGRKKIGADIRKEWILYATTGMPRYGYVLRLFPNSQFLDYLEREKKLLLGITDKIIKKLRLRVFANDFGWECVSRWKGSLPDINIESTSIPFLESLENCRIFITDHPSTTYLEALAANKPTILFWNKDIFPARTEAEPYFNELRAAGILHDTPESAAAAVNLIYQDVECWWQEPLRRKTVANFCDRFARTSKYAVNQWLDQLLLINKGSDN